MPSSPSDGTRAAASSMASAMPSRRRQISPMRAADPGSASGSRSAPAWRARSTNRATASPIASPGRDRPGTGKTCSKGSISRAWLVARTPTPGQRPSRRSTKGATPSSRCSQLSSTSRVSASAHSTASASSTVRPRGSSRPMAALTAPAIWAGSVTGTRSTNHAPSRRSPASSAATATARRLLPTPPGPRAVTSRSRPRAARSSATSAARPTKEVSGTGRPRPGAARRPLPASRASSRRSDAPSLRSRELTWLSTVRTDTNSREAISALVACSAMSSSTSASRSDTPASLGPPRIVTLRVCRMPAPNRPRVSRGSVAVRGGSVVGTDGKGAAAGARSTHASPRDHHPRRGPPPRPAGRRQPGAGLPPRPPGAGTEPALPAPPRPRPRVIHTPRLLRT